MKLKTLLFASAALLAAQTAGDRANLSVMTSRILSLAAQARQAISIQNKDAARTEINAALELADKVLRASPTRQSPIYTELDEVSILEPIQMAKARQGGQADRPQGRLPVRAEGELVQSVTGTFTSVSLDVERAREQLLSAKTDIENGKLPEADSALNALQAGVVLRRVETDLPLIGVRQNLIRAKSLLAQGNADAVGTPLKAAADALLEYQTTSMAQHAGDALRLQREIEANMNSATPEKIDAWWNRVVSWLL